VTGPNQRSALAALEAARPIVARLDPARHPEETAADLIELWSSVETALRSLMGGSMLSGQTLVRELRHRELISLEQAHSLLELLAVRDRVQHTDYHPTAGDIGVAREAYTALGEGLTAPTPTAQPTLAPQPAAPPSQGIDYMPPPDTGQRRGPGLMIVLVILALLAAAGALYYYYTTRPGGQTELARGIQAFNAGRKEEARAYLERVARADSSLALPHIYLGRIAREEGDLATAGRELRTAVQLEPRNAVAHRELGALFLSRAQQFANQQRPDLAKADYDAARRSYVRALQLDPSDRTAQGYLGCALVRLGRTQEGVTWLSRAGQGSWSVCAPQQQTSPSPPRP
jgi:tetratricopeptide (TPR) repeat protein